MSETPVNHSLTETRYTAGERAIEIDFENVPTEVNEAFGELSEKTRKIIQARLSPDYQKKQEKNDDKERDRSSIHLATPEEVEELLKEMRMFKHQWTEEDITEMTFPQIEANIGLATYDLFTNQKLKTFINQNSGKQEFEGLVSLVWEGRGKDDSSIPYFHEQNYEEARNELETIKQQRETKAENIIKLRGSKRERTVRGKRELNELKNQLNDMGAYVDIEGVVKEDILYPPPGDEWRKRTAKLRELLGKERDLKEWQLTTTRLAERMSSDEFATTCLEQAEFIATW